MFTPPPPPPRDGPNPAVIEPARAAFGAGIDPLVPLFAPYCGGVSQQQQLQLAVGQLLKGEWQGERRLDGDGVRPFTLSWHGEPAPLETLRCQLSFPAAATVHYDFSLPAYRLVRWLMQCQDHQLPVSFWRWLLLGEVPRSADLDLTMGESMGESTVVA